MEKNNNTNTFKVVLITLSVIFFLIFAGFVFIKSNSPLSIILKQGLKKLTGIEIVDDKKVREIELQLIQLKVENTKLTFDFNKYQKEKEQALKIVQEQEQKIVLLNIELGQLKTRNQQLRDERTQITPMETIFEFDEFTNILGQNLSGTMLFENKYTNQILAQTPIERIEEANVLIIEGIYAKEENVILSSLNTELRNTITPLRSMNASLENQLEIAVRQGEIAVEERDMYKDLYSEIDGKTRKNLLIAYGVIALETTIIVLMLLNK